MEQRMRHQRIVVSHYCGAEALNLIEEDVPEPQAGEVRVKV
jgi:NADPH2:quinone reductase